jgi:hypothetical protein
MPDFHLTFRDLLHAVNIRHGTNGFTSLPKECRTVSYLSTEEVCVSKLFRFDQNFPSASYVLSTVMTFQFF